MADKPTMLETLEEMAQKAKLLDWLLDCTEVQIKRGVTQFIRGSHVYVDSTVTPYAALQAAYEADQSPAATKQ